MTFNMPEAQNLFGKSTQHLEGENLGSLPGADDITRVEISNRIVVLARENFNSPSVVISGYLPAGNLLESDDKLGLAAFTAAALMRGTKSRNFQEIFNALESAGASLQFEGATHTTSFNGRALAEDLDLLLELCAESLRQPVFPTDQVERLRAQILTGLAIRAQDTGEMASLTFDKLVYAGHPYSRPEDGYPETIANITREDLQEFHHHCYGPRGMVIALVGAVDSKRAVERISEILGGWENPDQCESPALPPVSAPTELLTQEVKIPGKIQTDIIVGSIGPERRSSDFLTALIANNILGQFGMMGRIGEVVREQEGMAYYAYSSLVGGSGPGPWYVSAGVNPTNVDRAIELIRQEIARFVNEPVTAEELADSQTNFIGRLPLSLESNGGVASALLSLERFDLGLDYLRQYPDLIKAITVEDMLETAKRYLHPDRLGIAIAGP
ncbi:MAG: M16 family metallopeptidase [Anaerolineales bacterium]